MNNLTEIKIKKLVKLYLSPNFTLEESRILNNELALELNLDEFRIMHWCIREALLSRMGENGIQTGGNAPEGPPKP